MFTFLFDNNSRVPLYLQLYEYIKSEINCGNLKKGEKLPSKRTLSAHLKISQVTVESAYAQLIDEGYIKSKSRSGFYVNVENFGNTDEKSPETKIIIPKENLYKYDFTTRGVDTDCFPFSIWAKLLRRVLSEQNHKLLKPSDVKGAYELRSAISKYLYDFRGISADPEMIVIGAGSEYLIGMIIQLLGRNKIYGIENPGYIKTRKLFRKNSVKVISVNSDENGLSVEDLKLRNCNIIHTTPSHHFPLGTFMPIGERMNLLKWAYENPENYIIEDEYDSEFRFSGRPLSSLFSLDKNGKVIYMNTFTKTLAPSLRISYMILPEKLMKKFESELGFYSNTVSIFEQITLSRFISEGYFERHINRIKKIYRQRRDLLVDIFKNSSISDKISIEGENSGLHFIIRFNTDKDEKHLEKQLIDVAKENSVRVYGLREYYSFIPENYRSGIVIGYSSLSKDDIKEASKILISAWEKIFN